MGNLEPVIHLTLACNHKCLFCSRKGDPPESEKEVDKILKKFKHTVTIEGGEPALSKNLISTVLKAKKADVREIMLVTNGYSLDKPENIKKLLEAGVDVFNFNFPSHSEKLYDAITGSSNFQKTVTAIKNCVNIAGPEKTRLTFVINSLNYKYLAGYARFVKKEFGNIFYAEINMIKVLGSVRKRIWLVPKLSQAAEKILQGFKEFEKLGLNFIYDGIPLCLVKGFESKNIDAAMAAQGGLFSCGEKKHFSPCLKCLIKEVCPGPRKDYVKLYGSDELNPVKNTAQAAEIKRRLKK